MEIAAIVKNSPGRHEVFVRTASVTQALAVPAKTTGNGLGVNGGEFLMLAKI